MSGRHAQRGHRRRFWSRITAAVVAVGMLAVGAYVLSDYLRDDDVGRVRQQGAPCDAPTVVSVVAEPNISPVLSQIVENHQAAIETPDGECVEFEVAATPSAAVVRELADGGGPDVWVPESTLWLQRVPDNGPELGEPRQIATSPLVVVAPKPLARDLGWPDAEFSWTDMLGGEVPATIADPMATTEGLATLLAVHSVVGGGAEDQARIVEAMTPVSRSAVADVDTAYDLVSSGSSSAALFTATEQSVVRHNEEDPEHGVVALYPVEGTPAFDYPAVSLSPRDDGAGDDPTRSAAIEGLLTLLQAEPAVAALQEAGFRSAEGVARESAGIVDGTQAQMPTPLPLPEPEAVSAAQRQWAALSLDMRMLAVIDVSGSMWETEDDAPPPIEVVRDANLAALELIPPTSDLGLWVFSTEEDPPNHWREVVELGPLTDEVGDGTRLDALVAETKALPDSEVRGWTALYDTAWAAFRAVKENYDPNRVNSVVLLTDGEDERAAEMEPGMDLETLLAQLQAQHDPARPVLVITIGIGPDADMAALEQISGATGASAYQAVDPADLPEIFFQAMVERQCRPNC